MSRACAFEQLPYFPYTHAHLHIPAGSKTARGKYEVRGKFCHSNITPDAHLLVLLDYCTQRVWPVSWAISFGDRWVSRCNSRRTSCKIPTLLRFITRQAVNSDRPLFWNCSCFTLIVGAWCVHEASPEPEKSTTRVPVRHVASSPFPSVSSLQGFLRQWRS